MSVKPLGNASLQSTEQDEKAPKTAYQRLDEKRKCTTAASGDWKENDPEGRIRRDEERKRRKYTEKRLSGGCGIVGGDRDDRRGVGGGARERSRESADIRRKFEPRSRRSGDVGGHDLRSSAHGTRSDTSRRHDRRSHASPKYSGRADDGARPQTKIVAPRAPRTKETDAVDVVQEMLKSFPAGGKDPWAPITASWGEEMDAQDSKSESKQSGAPNPWRKSESTGERETDPKRLAKRQRQLDIGKSGPEYKLYCDAVPRHERTKHHPQTPDKRVACSTRSWEGVMRVWRRKLHYWDPPEAAEEYQKKFANIVPFDNDDEDDDDDEEGKVQEDCEMDSRDLQDADVDLDEETERKLLENDTDEESNPSSSEIREHYSTQNVEPNNAEFLNSDPKSLHIGEDITEAMLFTSEI